MEIIVTILIGALAGWLASKLLGFETSSLVHILLGVVGGIIGSELFAVFNVSVGSGIVRDIVTATIGAFLLVLGFRLISRKKK